MIQTLTEKFQAINASLSELETQGNRLTELTNLSEEVGQSLLQIRDNLTALENLVGNNSAVDQDELDRALAELELTESNFPNLKAKLTEILNSANQDDEQLHQELTQITERITQIVNNYQAQIIQLESKLKSNQTSAQELATRTNLISAGIGFGLGGLALALVNYLRNKRK